LTTNLLSVYQITRGAQGKTIEFTLDHVYIRDIETREIIATRVVDHACHLYSFCHFSLDDDIPLIDVHTLPSRVNHVCEEKFGHLNLGVLETSVELHPPSPLASSDLSSSLE